MSEHNWQGIAEAVRESGGVLRPGDISALYGTMEALRHLPFPPGYLDAIRVQMVDALLGQSRTAQNQLNVYLAFHGGDSGASFMKVGVARQVSARMSALKTGNPLARLWTFSAVLPDRRSAYRLEKAILGHLKDRKAEGEWVEVCFTNLDAAWTFVESLEVFGRQFLGDNSLRFDLVGA